MGRQSGIGRTGVRYVTLCVCFVCVCVRAWPPTHPSGVLTHPPTIGTHTHTHTNTRTHTHTHTLCVYTGGAAASAGRRFAAHADEFEDDRM